MNAQVISLDKLGKNDIDKVGGKNASLGEMISHLTDLGVSVPGGFATTADAFNKFLLDTGLQDKIKDALVGLDVNDVAALTATGKKIRDAELKKLPFMLVVGENEELNNTISVRRRGEGDLGAMSVDDFISYFNQESKI